jgi:hypothetical protein
MAVQLLLACAAGVVAAAVSTTPLGLPPIATSFIAKQWNNCSEFVGCPSKATFTQLIAQDGTGFKARTGPTSLLPAADNQVFIQRFDLGEQYLLHVDSTKSPLKVLSCSKAPVAVPSNQTRWALDYVFGLVNHAHFDAMAPCTSSRSPDCQVWRDASTSHAGCLNNKSYTVHQGLMYLMAPTAEPVAPSTPFSVSRFTNDLYYPSDMPKLCHTAGRADHMWWHTNWSSISITPGQPITRYYTPSGATSGFEMCFAPSAFGAGGKHVSNPV